MAEDLPVDQDVGVLGDVGGVVGHPLEVPDGAQQEQAGLHLGRPVLHPAQEPGDDGRVVGVDGRVLREHRLGRGGVPGEEGAGGPVDHARGPGRHAPESVGFRDGWEFPEPDRPLRQALGQVCHPVEFGRHLHEGDDAAEVAGEGLVAGE